MVTMDDVRVARARSETTVLHLVKPDGYTWALTWKGFKKQPMYRGTLCGLRISQMVPGFEPPEASCPVCLRYAGIKLGGLGRDLVAIPANPP